MISEEVFGLKSEVSCDVARSRRQWRVPWRCFQLVFATVVVFAMAGPSLGADTTQVVSRQRLMEFRKAYSVTYLRMGTHGVPVSIDGALSTGLTAGSPYELVLAFLELNRDVFRMTDPRTEWRLLGETVDKRANKRHLRLQQVYHGLEVYAIQLTAHFSSTGRLEAIGTSYQPGIDLPSSPAVAKEEAQRIVERAVASFDSLDLSRCRQIVYPWQGQYCLAWRIVAVPGGEYFVNALTGDVIYHWSGMPDGPEGLPRMHQVDSTAPVAPERIFSPPLNSPNGPRRIPAGAPPDTRAGTPDSQPGSPSVRILRIDGGSASRSLNLHPLRLVKPPDSAATPADTTGGQQTTTPKEQSQAVQDPGSLITITTQGFEGTFPTGSWHLYGSPTWKDDNCKPHAGYWSAWH